jgi:cytochrome c-type biogenesis protein CcmH/NrfG
VLEKEKENVKCLLRRGRAYLELEEGEKSREDLLKALRLEPHNQDARDLLKATNHLIASQNEIDARIAKKMLAFDL